MKRLLYTLAILLFCGEAMAQAITINASKPVITGSVDSCALPTPGALAALTSLSSAATNATWDISSTALQNAYATYQYRIKTTGFPSAQFADSTTYTVGPSTATSYKAWRNIQQVTGTGVLIQGEEILTRQAKSLQSQTGNNLDSIIFPTQVLSYASPLRQIKFPATMGTVWLDSVARNLSFNVTVPALSMSNTPGQQRQRRIYLDSVVGWGKMKVPEVGGTSSPYIAVLQIHHRDVQLDSFFINGSAASATVLSALGVSQGQSTTVSRTYFYRANAYRPLIEIVHSTPSHSSVASTFYIHAVDLDATGVSAIPLGNEVRVYPNPLAKDGILHINMPGNTGGAYHYSLLNIAGQQMAQGIIDLPAGITTATVTMPLITDAGIYYLSISSPGKQELIVPVTIE